MPWRRYLCCNSEEYGVGFRKGSDLTAKCNEFFAAAKADGSMQKIAETYKVQGDCDPEDVADSILNGE